MLQKPTRATLLSCAPAQPCPARAAQSLAGPPQPKALVRKQGAFRNTRRESDLSSPRDIFWGMMGREMRGSSSSCPGTALRAPPLPARGGGTAEGAPKDRHRGVTLRSGGESQRGTLRGTHPTPDRMRNHERDGGPRALHLQPRRGRLSKSNGRETVTPDRSGTPIATGTWRGQGVWGRHG